jgi:hypothetical protein
MNIFSERLAQYRQLLENTEQQCEVMRRDLRKLEETRLRLEGAIEAVEQFEQLAKTEAKEGGEDGTTNKSE